MNILFTGDIFRPSLVNGVLWPSQKYNIEKFAQIFSENLKNSNISLSVISDGFNGNEVDVKAIFTELNYIPGYDSWASTYNNFPNGSKSYASFTDLLESFDTVIGFELPNHLMSFLTSKKIPFFSIQISPVRFFGERIYIDTNEASDFLLKNSFKSEIHDAQLRSVAIKSKLQYRMNVLKDKTSLSPENSLLICLQTLYDKVRINDKKFARIWDFKDNLLSMSLNFDTILIKPHPLEHDPSEIIYLRKLFFSKKTLIVSDDIYKYFSDPNVNFISSISSSSSFEAKFFGKKSSCFYKDFYQNAESFFGKKINRFYVGSNHLNNKEFWSQLINVK